MASEDPVVAEYRKHLDKSLLRENLRRTPTERLIRLMEMQRLAEEMRRGMRARRAGS
ncbi:MAG: hypothetical protein J0I12_13810 [Candidatus Eremiobacteraeota bacterium]|nr:hypothetical protein [Candidatus Eremiobacteraeota bacterium]